MGKPPNSYITTKHGTRRKGKINDVMNFCISEIVNISGILNVNNAMSFYVSGVVNISDILDVNNVRSFYILTVADVSDVLTSIMLCVLHLRNCNCFRRIACQQYHEIRSAALNRSLITTNFDQLS